MGKLDGKVAFITGAARGQGRSHALTLAREGADIIAVDICKNLDTLPYALGTPDELNETVDLVEKLGRKIVATAVDTRDREGIRQALADGVDQLGRLDIVLPNAGIMSIGPVEDVTEEIWNDVLGTNLTGVFFTAQTAIPYLKANPDGGSIVFTGSTASELGIQNVIAYVASKHGVIGLTKALSNELGPFNIRVNAVLPTGARTGMIEHDATVKLFDPNNTDGRLESVAHVFRNQQVLPFPWLESQDISEVVLFLVSHEGRYITGSSMRIDGGAITKQ
jgi:SDR family mycofactocin-dependent oxidoreductase